MPTRFNNPEQAPGVALKRIPLRKAAVLFIATVCLCLCGLLYLQLEQSRRHDLSLAQVASSNLTRAMAQQAEDTFMKADLVLTSLVDWIQVDGFGQDMRPRLQQTFARRMLALDQLHGILLFDQKGQWVVTSFENLPRGTGVADREYFKYHQQNVSSVAHIGPAIRSRENGEWIIPVSKRVNDTYGHVVGDHCLAEVARALKSCCHRKADLAVRYGGEEFAVLLPDTDIHGAMTIAEQIRRSVIDKNITHTGSPNGYVTVSLGCYSFVPSGRDSMDVFVERADAALYQAKHSGRNRVATLSMAGGGEALMRSDR
ncbi:diguanylate cyclase [Pseudomonas sp. FW305-70]|uniref:diguanylate cyclase n=1 Tax=Pseudomonas sp. FW305-70 TaxID=2751342 RepID=UPI000C88A323|nr:diguanylate cyclase [Pseudomonas sp. FW305-70]PMZ71172.1 hypothetical protein C1X65_24065 [Pseudomonas sp. FW305-70]